MIPRLLVVSQTIDFQDSQLGFFHNWVEKFAGKFPSIVAICLKKGKFTLPQNVKVYSLGKEIKRSRFRYICRFYKYIWTERKNYDAVFVHMNQEYVLLGGWLWKILGKKVYMWRNHHSGSFLTDLAARFCNNVFCTSRFSYTAKYKKTILMPVGVDLDRFQTINYQPKTRNSILFLGRIAPTKNVHIFVEALGLLKRKNIQFDASICGGVLPADLKYLESLRSRIRELGLANVKILPGVSHANTPKLYNFHEIFVNLSSSGMYDKTIFEAMACGCLVLASNDNLKGEVDDRIVLEYRTSDAVARRLELFLNLSSEEKNKILYKEARFAEKHNLDALVDKLGEYMGF